ncbi:MAG TPA: trypsin-like peptidase domain-containing protein [Tepidisphaeraceae bacterium]|jgi:serine protease Do
MIYRTSVLVCGVLCAVLMGAGRATDGDGKSEAEKAIPATRATTKPTATQAAVEGAVPLFPDATPQVVTEVTRKIFPAVVRLDVAQEAYQEGKRTLRRGIGSGVIIDDEGRVLTNFHVAGKSAEIFVTLANKERVHGKLIGDDHWTDLAIVQMDMEEMKRKKATFAHAELGESTHLQPCENVMAVGTPFGLARTVTLGIVSNTERTFYPDDMKIDEYETGEFSNWIQMDTPINPGNSGGPLVDMRGRVVGINTRGGGQNLNFAVPVDTAKEVVAKILKSATAEKKGRVDRSDLGIDLKPLQDLENFYEIDINKGVLINSVDRGSPAMKAGVKTQDILLAIDGKPTNVRFPEEVAPARKMIADMPIGKEVQLTIRRGRGKDPMTITVKTQKLEGAVGEEKEAKVWGLSVRDVTTRYANEQQLDDANGVVVTTLSPGYPAAKAELQPSDVIRSVNGEKIEDLDAFMKTYEKLTKEKSGRVLMEVQRGRGIRRAVLKVEGSNES